MLELKEDYKVDVNIFRMIYMQKSWLEGVEYMQADDATILSQDKHDIFGEDSLNRVKTFNKLKEVIWHCVTNDSKMVDLNMLRGFVLELHVDAQHEEKLLLRRSKRNPQVVDNDANDPYEVRKVL